MGAYWLAPARRCFSTRSSSAGSGEKSGKPCDRLMAPHSAASLDITVKMVVPTSGSAGGEGGGGVRTWRRSVGRRRAAWQAGLRGAGSTRHGKRWARAIPPGYRRKLLLADPNKVHGRPDDGLPAHHRAPLRARGAILPQDRAGHPAPRQVDPPVQLRRLPRPRAEVRQRAAAPRREAGRPRGHAGLEHPRHLEAYFAVPLAGAVLHTLNPRLSAADLAYIMDHADDQVLLVDDVLCRCGSGSGARACPRWSSCPRAPGRPGDAGLRGAARGGAGEGGIPRIRGGPGGGALLHVGHDRQAQGRRSTPTARRCCTPRRLACPTRSASAADWCCRWCRCSTSTPGACPYRRGAGRRQAGASRARTSTRRALLELIETERVTVAAGVPTIWLGMLRRSTRTGQATTCSRAHAPSVIGGSAVPAGDDRGLPGAPRRRGAPRLGHDRDDAARHASRGFKPHLARPPDGEQVDAARDAGPAAAVRRDRALVDDDGEPLPWDGKAMRRAAGARPVDRARATSTSPRGRRSFTTTAGSAPATSSPSTPTATSDHRPHQGRHQVGRRVDQLGRARERAHGPPGGGRGGGDRRAAPEVGRAAAGLRRAARGADGHADGAARVPRADGSRSGGCPTRSCSWPPSRAAPPASSSRRRCESSSRTSSWSSHHVPAPRRHRKGAVHPNGLARRVQGTSSRGRASPRAVVGGESRGPGAARLRALLFTGA